MNRNTLIILGIIAAVAIIAVIYYSNRGTSAPAMAPKCCIAYDSLGNCKKYVWCSNTNAISTFTSPNGTIFTHINEIPLIINPSVPAGAK